MALAYLCSRWQHFARPPGTFRSRFYGDILARTRFQAFVVNHGVREGSDIEAEAVSKALENLSKAPRIMTYTLQID